MNPSEPPSLLMRASDRAWRVLVVLAVVGVAVAAAVALAAVLVPVLLAVLVVPTGRPAFKRLSRRLPRSLAAALVLIAAVVALAAAGWLMTASIAANWNELWSGITDGVTAITDWVDDRISGLTDQQVTTAEENLTDLASAIPQVLIGGISDSVAVLGAVLVGFFLFLVTFYFGLRDWDNFRAWFLGMTAPSAQPKVDQFFDRFSSVLRNYWKAEAQIGLFDALAMGFGLWMIGVPLAFPVAVMTFALSFIPYLGAIVSAALAVFLALGVGGTGDAALALLLSLFVFNTAENLLRPSLVGATIEMPTFVAFITSTVGVLLAGTFGAILAIPLVALVGEFRRIFLADANAGAAQHADTAR